MRVAITGASGFVGGHITRSLARDGHSVLAFSRRALPEVQNVETIQWDLHDRVPVLQQVVDTFIHAAATTELATDAQKANAINVIGTKKAYKLANKMKAKQFIYISSASVYSSLENKYRVSEVFKKASSKDNNYAITKLKAEEYLKAQRDIPVIILRPHIVYGPGDTRVLYELLGRVRAHTIRLPIESNHELSITHVGNIVEAVRFFINHSQTNHSEVYNIADNKYVSSLGFIKSLIKCADPTIKIKTVNKLPAQCAALASEALGRVTQKRPLLTRNLLRQLNQDSSISIDKVLSTGFLPRYKLDGGLKDIAKWLNEYGGVDQYLTNSSESIWQGVIDKYVY